MFDDVAYFRGQALLCLNMARAVSDSASATLLRDEAMAHTLHADTLEDAEDRSRQHHAVIKRNAPRD
jgi:hypothetical protein